MSDGYRNLFLDKQDQLLDVSKKAMAYLKILSGQKVKIDGIKQKMLELCWKIEALPASEAQTEISIMASDLYSEIALIAAELDDYGDKPVPA